jgi:DNA invertase Pin-like site-specific DNA recombinase
VNATAYVRVSSRAQDDATQRAAIERAASARGDTIATWYAEKRSAKTTARAELQRLRDDARAGHVRRLYVFKLDRLARSGIRDTFEVVDELRASGVEIVTIADGFSLDGPAADVILAVMAWAAKMERLAIGERIAAARERIEAEGGRWGRPSRVDRATRERAAELRAEGKTVREIARTLHVPRSTIARALAQSAP